MRTHQMGTFDIVNINRGGDGCSKTPTVNDRGGTEEGHYFQIRIKTYYKSKFSNYN